MGTFHKVAIIDWQQSGSMTFTVGPVAAVRQQYKLNINKKQFSLSWGKPEENVLVWLASLESKLHVDFSGLIFQPNIPRDIN